MFEFYKHPEWFRLLNRNGYNTDELETKVDDLVHLMQDEEKYWRKIEYNKVLKDIHNWKQEPEMKTIKAEFLEKALEEAKETFKELRQQAFKLIESNMGVPEHLIKSGENLRKRIDGMQTSLDILRGYKVDTINDEMIMQAKAFPLERLIEIDSRGFALCLWHSDSRPSMFCKNNYVHCFTCNHSTDSIGVYQELHNCGFKQAVLELNNL